MLLPNLISKRRSAWITWKSLEKKKENKNQNTHIILVIEYNQNIKVEFSSICNDLINIVDKNTYSINKNIQKLSLWL